MTADELLALFRDEISDAVEPFLWSDTLVYSYIDDAQKMFCRKTEGISDATTPVVTQLPVAPGTTWLDLDPTLLKIRTATRSDDGRDIELLNREDLVKRGWRYDGVPGRLRALVLGMEANRARVFPDASEALTIELMVFRLPLDPILGEADEIEIDEQHHRHLLMWMKALAYGKQDAETFDKTKKREFEQDFLAYCADVQKEQERARHKTRVVAYGGQDIGGACGVRRQRGFY